MDTQLRLDNVIAQLSFQSRTEKEGKKRVPATTLKFVATVPADMLGKFDAHLKASFYRKELKTDEPVPDMADEGIKEEMAAADGLNRLKYSRADNIIEWEELFPEYTAVIDFGAGPDSAIELEEVTIDAFQFTLKDGGSMGIQWNVSCHPDQEDAGKLYTLNGSQVTISLLPPGVTYEHPGQQNLLKDAGKKTPTTRRSSRAPVEAE